jgi:predicted amidohydrolase YtcJ
MKTILSALALGFLLGAPALAGENDRTILHHGRIFTADPQRPWAEALAFQGNNVIAVGSEATVLPLANRPGTRVIDLGGRLVVPGINDAHVHIAAAPGVRLNAPNFIPGPGPTLPEVVALLQAGAAATSPGTWLVVSVGDAVLDDPAAHRLTLDPATPQHPVRLEAWTGHGMILNTKALRVLGIADEEPDPLAGRFERFPGTATVNGVAHEYAEHLVHRRLYDTLSDAELAAQYQAYAAAAVTLGFTSAQDIPVGITAERALRVLRTAGLKMRIRSIGFPLTPGEPCESARSGAGLETASGLKWIADGTPIERLAFLTAPYADRPTLGEFNFPAGAFAQIFERGLSGSPATNQLLFHAVGDGAIGRILDGLDASGGTELWADRRTRIEHGDMLFAPEFGRARDLGVVIVQNPTHFTLAGLFAQRFTGDVFARLEPMQSLLSEGIPLALGTDGIGVVFSPWVDIFLAAIHPTHPAEALTIEQGIVAYTRGSAYAEFEEHRKGTLAPGKLADLAVLSQDVTAVPLGQVPATGSILTVVDGRVVWDAGVLH